MVMKRAPRGVYIPDNMFYGWIQNIKYYSRSLPSVTLSSTVSTLKVSNSSVVTITATFSKSMKSTLKLFR